LLVIGLANSGKTTLVNALRAARRETVKSRSTTTVTPKKNHDEEVVPTMGFAVERFSVLNTTLTVVDMSGQSKYKDTLWECYYEDANAVVFVVDAAESEENVDAARAALEFFLSSPNAEKTGDAKKKKKNAASFSGVREQVRPALGAERERAGVFDAPDGRVGSAQRQGVARGRVLRQDGGGGAGWISLVDRKELRRRRVSSVRINTTHSFERVYESLSFNAPRARESRETEVAADGEALFLDLGLFFDLEFGLNIGAFFRLRLAL
jgi:GTPase SAR1 family protein